MFHGKTSLADDPSTPPATPLLLTQVIAPLAWDEK